MNKLKTFQEFINESEVNEKMALIDYNNYAQIILDAFNAAPKFDRSATKHWDSLLDSSRDWYKRMMSDIEIEMVDKEVYNSVPEMIKRVKAEKKIYVTREYRDHPYWNDEEYRMFRAVHDYIVHVLGKSNFDLRGEMKATNLHMKLIPELAKPALFMEIPCNVANIIITGKAPDQIKIAALNQFDFENIGNVEGYEVVNKKLVKTTNENIDESKSNIIGQTKSSKEIYLNPSLSDVDDYTKEDHKEAAALHHTLYTEAPKNMRNHKKYQNHKRQAKFHSDWSSGKSDKSTSYGSVKNFTPTKRTI